MQAVHLLLGREGIDAGDAYFFMNLLSIFRILLYNELRKHFREQIVINSRKIIGFTGYKELMRI